jgi:hypothetical protein
MNSQQQTLDSTQTTQRTWKVSQAVTTTSHSKQDEGAPSRALPLV